jgi:hypothetical protein
MISKFKQIEDLFREIDTKIKEKVNIYVIGGAALLFRGFKGSTKDIDIIVKSSEEKMHFENALKNIGFSGNKLTDEYKNLEITYILKRDDFRIDLFMKQVCSTLSISRGIEDRAENIFSGKNLNVFVCSNEDILLFKVIARREADIEDCIALARQSLDWSIILKEINHQIKKGKEIWITYLAEGLEKIEEKDIEVPIMKEIMDSYEDYMNKLT